MLKRRARRMQARIQTLIGRAVEVQGDIQFSGGLHVEGRVTGSVQARPEAAHLPTSLSVSRHGVIEGSVSADHVVLDGRVEGDIRARERVVLGSTAEVRGDVEYGVIEMALGARIRGRLVPRSEPSSPVFDAPPGPA